LNSAFGESGSIVNQTKELISKLQSMTNLTQTVIKDNLIFQSKISSLETSVNSLQSENQQVKKDNQQFQSKISSLETSVNSLQNKISSLETYVNSLQSENSSLRSLVSTINGELFFLMKIFLLMEIKELFLIYDQKILLLLLFHLFIVHHILLQIYLMMIVLTFRVIMNQILGFNFIFLLIKYQFLIF
jgi:uncharacterized phage infection (PIP) family protein YhgE